MGALLGLTGWRAFCVSPTHRRTACESIERWASWRRCWPMRGYTAIWAATWGRGGRLRSVRWDPTRGRGFHPVAVRHARAEQATMVHRAGVLTRRRGAEHGHSESLGCDLGDDSDGPRAALRAGHPAASWAVSRRALHAGRRFAATGIAEWQGVTTQRRGVEVKKAPAGGPGVYRSVGFWGSGHPRVVWDSLQRPERPHARLHVRRSRARARLDVERGSGGGAGANG